MNRPKNLDRLKTEAFDVCVIGAGATGAGVALDAISRGLKVALIDRSDFCAETSSRSTKLIHGGVRYLEQAFKKFDFAQLTQVKHGLREREILLKIAPHLVHPLPIITPVFSWFSGFYYFLGLKLYDYFADSKAIPKAGWLTKTETLRRIPALNQKLHSAVLYYDGTFNDARFCLAMVQKADALGAVVANYVNLREFEKDGSGKIVQANLTDLIENEEFTLKANVFVNCTGPFADSVRVMAEPGEQPRIGPSKGVHLVFSSAYLKSKHALLIPKTKDGRVVFVKPLENKVMAGTTDTAYAALEEEPKLEEEELDYILETLGGFMRELPQKNEISAGFAGVRPLLVPKSAKRHETKSFLRDHEIEQLPKSGLISVLGGKWTTYRVMAADAVNEVMKRFKKMADCQTDEIILFGGENLLESRKALETSAEAMGLSADTVQHLFSNYGNRALAVLTLAGEDVELLKRILPDYPYLMVEVKYALQYEMALKFRDFLSRRIRLEILDWFSALKAMDKIANIFAEELGWEQEKIESEKANYRKLVDDFFKSARIEPINQDKKI